MARPDLPPRNESETVADFREAFHDRYGRLQAFYDATSNSMRNYNLAHVSNIHGFYHELMTEFGTSIKALRLRQGNQPEANEAISFCAQRANATLSDKLTNFFYPTFEEIQAETSKIQLLTLNALSRGNVFDEKQSILDYLTSQYEVLVMQWLNSVSQLFRWEKTRVEVTGNFYVEEMNMCLCEFITESPRCPQEFMPTKL